MAGPLTTYYVIIALRTGAARVSGTLPSFIFREYRISLIDIWNSTRYYNGSAQMSGTSFRNPNGGFFCVYPRPRRYGEPQDAIETIIGIMSENPDVKKGQHFFRFEVRNVFFSRPNRWYFGGIFGIILKNKHTCLVLWLPYPSENIN
jgi:hypothetical protein